MNKSTYSDVIANLIYEAHETLSHEDFNKLVDWIKNVLGDYA